MFTSLRLQLNALPFSHQHGLRLRVKILQLREMNKQNKTAVNSSSDDAVKKQLDEAGERLQC